jgi:hypothetical protein
MLLICPPPELGGKFTPYPVEILQRFPISRSRVFRHTVSKDLNLSSCAVTNLFDPRGMVSLRNFLHLPPWSPQREKILQAASDDEIERGSIWTDVYPLSNATHGAYCLDKETGLFIDCRQDEEGSDERILQEGLFVLQCCLQNFCLSQTFMQS